MSQQEFKCQTSSCDSQAIHSAPHLLLNPLPEQDKLSGRKTRKFLLSLLTTASQPRSHTPDVLAKRGALMPAIHKLEEASWKNINWKIHPLPALTKPLSCQVCSLLEVYDPLVVYVPNPEFKGICNLIWTMDRWGCSLLEFQEHKQTSRLNFVWHSPALLLPWAYKYFYHFPRSPSAGPDG